MKLNLPLWIAAMGLMIISSGASATVLQDNYVGSNSHGYGDVIANSGVTMFNVDSLGSTLNGTRLTVTIYTNFAGNAGVDSRYTTNNTGIGYGDLFLSTGWTPSGSNPYTTDNAANGNHWTYAFSLDNPLSNAGGKGTVYALGAGTASNHNPDVLLSDHFIDCGSHCIYRNGQAVAVNKSLATATNTTGTWTVGNGFLSFSFDTLGLNLDTNDLGFHWTMYCGNDVIEGQDAPTQVPEPSSVYIFLLGLALVGVGVMRRRRV
ncbi:PEP-CTERM sorting domain-containing protein [Dyella sp. A6]|uniref:PEP-CTERM sorting domain-containing protein n=1 Tax=Dyella aluminiiresistens TaxID=3069105 RepID=UPI002E76DC7A|nr:PEP-CTERM sorting domain-containing protein [Dyella sp. A6]